MTFVKCYIYDQTDAIWETWSGGKTAQLFIYPEHSGLKTRDFDFRISTATFLAGESDFSDFSGYERLLTPLEGDMELSIADRSDVTLSPFHIERFNGGLKTKSNTAQAGRDFNLIFKESHYGNMERLSDDGYDAKANSWVFVYSDEDCLRLEIKCSVDLSVTVPKNGILILHDTDSIQIKRESTSDVFTNALIGEINLRILF